jgi:hypothetical protein
MPERNINRPKTAEDWGDHISEFAAKCEFGTPEFQALSDLYNLANLSEETKSEEASQFLADGHLVHLPHETRVGLILQRIVLLEHSIDQKKATIPGYSKAYNNLTVAFQELNEAARKDADSRFKSDHEQQKSYIYKVYVDVLDSIADDIFDVHNR